MKLSPSYSSRSIHLVKSSGILALIILCAWLSGIARAGSGSIDAGAKTIDLNVLFTYQETDALLSGTGNPTWKQVFSEASKSLWNATNGQLRIGKVIVYLRALDKKDDADIWIAQNTGGAYATDVAKLGVAGQHMQFYQKTHRSLAPGYRGNFSIVHEMGHYAFGCYDEYIGYSVPLAKKDTWTNADLTYVGKNAHVFSISSSNTITSIMDGGGGVSPQNQRTEFDTAGNIFKGEGDATKWFMNKQWVKYKESCWETMGKLQFGGATVFATVPAGDSATDFPAGWADIDWQVIPTLSRLVLCVDRSGSMSDENRMELAIAGAKIFVSLTEEAHQFKLFEGTADEEIITIDGDQLGVVDFDDAVTTTFALTTIDKNGTAKTNARSAIDGLYARGSTAIGDGLQQSLSLITGAGEKTTQEAVILMSDGQDNSSSISPATAAANCQARGVRVFTIALGSGADASTLANISATSNGKFYQATNSLGLIGIYPKIYAELKGGGLLNAINSLAHENEEQKQFVEVDEFTQEVTFSIASADTGWGFSVKSPSGQLYTGSDPVNGVVFENNGNELHFRIAAPEPGKWTLLISAPDGTPNQTFQYTVVKTSSSPGVNVSATTEKTTYSYPEPVLLQCTVTAKDPVAGAEVVADVTGPNGITSKITLFDDGDPAQGDESANDGIYSALFSNFLGSGVYSFSVHVVNKTGFQGILNPECEDSGTDFVPQSIPPFQRSSDTAVTVQGAPTVDAKWLRVDALSITRDHKTPSTGTVKFSATLNMPAGTFSPLTDYLSIYINGYYLTLNSSDFIAPKKGSTYKIEDKANKISGTLKLNIGGSSRCELVVTQKNAYVGSVSFFSPASVTVNNPSYSFYESVSINVDIPEDKNNIATGMKFVSGKNFANTPTLFIDGLKMVVNKAATDKDTLRVVATFEGGGGNYDPATQNLIVGLGGVNLTIPAGTLTGPKQVFKGKLQSGNGSILVTVDLAKHILSLNGSNQALLGKIQSALKTALQVGNFNQTGVIVTKQKESGKTDQFTY